MEPPNRSIIHMDLDAFFVSVECLRDSRLKGIPLIIGGKNGRGVVAACSYEARRFGVHSAMPSRLALQLCPDAMVISGDMEAYTKYSAMVTDIVREEAPLFEKASIDEFYIDVTGMDQFFGAFKWARELRRKVIENTQLPISMGLSVNKLVSKVATGEYKPNGEKQVPAGKERDFLAPLSVKKIPMVGEKTSQFLYDMGIHTVGTLRKMPVKMLQSAFGKNGVDLWNKANAIDSSPVVAYSEQKSISTECTFS
ncbi:MAG: DNA polymerase IV, partial [Saprospiraceae bacterium]|nr:DNA polymerase IV [Saprospiraceae bacterium]